MDWKLFSIVPAIMLVIVFLGSLYGAVQLWKLNRKFQAFLTFAVAVATAIGFYAIYGKDIFG